MSAGGRLSRLVAGKGARVGTAAAMTPAMLAPLGFELDASWRRHAGAAFAVLGAEHVCVILDGDEGIEIFVFDESRGLGEAARRHGVLAWQVTFAGPTPQAVVLAALAAALKTGRR